MDVNDRQAIDGLFTRIADVERQSPQIDREADAFIRDRMARQPAAPYLMAQTIVVQDQALAQAEERIRELEHQVRNAPRASGGGGLFSSLFGGSSQPSAPPRNPMPAAPANSPWGGQSATPHGAYPGAHPAGRGPGGGGFLAGAAQTAMGVAGGMLIGSAIGGMFAGDAEAAETPAAEDASDAGDAGGDEGGDFEF
ncbi:DUF2076 domain-containing protein [Rhizobium sp. CC-YZS058]|uniref:DUF2076 domain-containing protein n=1 Tax=Rhizobium sp. CC-YZS058 TaxID=3042153 RepID=UPI002B051AC2|nr:DUF2076 domain-containing protein [Rhizobium sp. CC-YZS058]MEA3536098.1 DUF2076 domain-containing protein [Rhizobium sp. CC-YZS058]